MLSKKILDILCCPKCHAGLFYNEHKDILTCTKCGIIYPVKNDIPILIIEDEQQSRS